MKTIKVEIEFQEVMRALEAETGACSGAVIRQFREHDYLQEERLYSLLDLKANRPLLFKNTLENNGRYRLVEHPAPGKLQLT